MTTPQRGAEVLFSIRFNPAKVQHWWQRTTDLKYHSLPRFPLSFTPLSLFFFRTQHPPSMQQQRAPTRPTPYQSFPFPPGRRARAFPMVFHLNDPGKNKNPFINSFWSTPSLTPWVVPACAMGTLCPHTDTPRPPPVLSAPHSLPPTPHSLFFFFFLSFPFFSFGATRTTQQPPLQKPPTHLPIINNV